MMATNPKYMQPDILSVLPDPLLDMDRWLLWKASPHPRKPGKTRKTPFYVSGRVRQGILDTEADLDQLASLNDALAEYAKGGYAGLGFALAADGVGAFDLDHILDEAGELIPTHPGYALAIEAEVLGCYMEKSPSGFGLRIVGPSSNYPAYSAGGLEWWCEKRFITLTGDLYANPKGWVPLDDLRKPLKTARERPVEREYDSEAIITPETMDELKSALQAISSDDRDLWVKIGMALKTIPNDKGFALWDDWSRTSDLYDEADAKRVWRSLRPYQTSHKAVFAIAQSDWGWQNPKSRSARDAKSAFQDEPDEEDLTPADMRVDFGDLDQLHPTEFILDGFLPVGVSVIAGAWGAGKSVNILPLMASVAHLSPAEWGFRPILRRKVVWVSEAPEQAHDTLFSLARAEGSAPAEEFKEWFYLFRANRQPPRKLARRLRRLVDECTYELENGFVVNPVVVLDTTSANIEIENESDNSMVSQAMAILKQSLPGISIVLIGHTPKALVKADVKDMTFRGAGAFEADAAATYFLVHDTETDTRFLAVRKCRFSPDYPEIVFDHEGGSQIIDTPWGEPQAKRYFHGVPTKSNGEERKRAREEVQEQRREEKKERALTERQQAVLSLVSDRTSRGEPTTRADIRRLIPSRSALLVEAINRLIESGRLQEHPWPTNILGQIRGENPMLILPGDVALDLFLERARNEGN